MAGLARFKWLAIFAVVVVFAVVTFRGVSGLTAYRLQVPLESVAKFKTANTFLSVNHQGQFPAVTISFNLAPGVSLGEGCRVGHHVVIHADTRVGANVRIDDHASLGKTPMRAGYESSQR